MFRYSLLTEFARPERCQRNEDVPAHALKVCGDCRSIVPLATQLTLNALASSKLCYLWYQFAADLHSKMKLEQVHSTEAPIETVIDT